MVKNDFLQIGFNFLHFTENNTTLTFNLLLPQNAVLDDVRQYLNGPTVTHLLYNTINIDNNGNEWSVTIW